MKVLAEYVMAGPRQASMFCLGFGLVPIIGPWLSSAAIVLIILQLGLTQAIKVLPWALLPGIVWAALGDPSYLILLTSVFLAALVLEMSRSLGLGLLAGVSVSALGFLIMISLLPNKLEQLTSVMNEVLATSPEMEKVFSFQGESEKIEKIEASENTSPLDADKKVINREELQQTIALLTKMAFAWASSISACLVLLVGRWWQSLLYKPGAFQAEFHALRLSWNQVLVVFAVIVLLMQGLDSLSDDKLGMVIAPSFTIPILLSGIALVHGLVAIAGMSVHWLGMFYVALLFVGHLIYLPLLVTALLDVVFDFRSRFRRKNSPE
jgi:hypothetical protein